MLMAAEYLILGANGYIGSYLFWHLKTDGFRVKGTVHQPSPEPDFIQFDALKDSVCDIGALVKGKRKIAIICIAQPNISRCKTEYELSRQINVEAVKRMVDVLTQENFYIIFFSTDNVFDGNKGDYKEQDVTNAVNQYGKMKEYMEFFLTEQYPQVCIFRLPKVLGTDREPSNLLTDLEEHLHGEVRCIKGMKMSIISKEDIYQSCLIAAERGLKGIYNLTNGEVWSRKALVERFCRHMGAPDTNILELELDSFHFTDARPLNIWLNNSKFCQETGYEFESFDKIVTKYKILNIL